MHIIYDGKDLYAMGVKVEKIIGKELPMVQGYLQIDPLSKILLVQNPRNPEERLMNWKITRPGLIRTWPSKPKPRWKPLSQKEINREIREAQAFWADKEKACRLGSPRAVVEVDALGFHFCDDSLIRWEGRVNPSPIRGRKCFAACWGGPMPCSCWSVGQMPQDLERRLQWLSSNRLAKAGERVSLDPVLLLDDRGDLFVWRVEEDSRGRSVAYSIATKDMLREVQESDGEAKDTSSPMPNHREAS